MKGVGYGGCLSLERIELTWTVLANVPLSSSGLFKPPQGLLPHEQVIWVRQTESGIQGRKGPIAILIFSFLFLTVGILGQSYAIIGFSALFIVIGAATFYSTATQRETRFYLTSFRIVETKNENIALQADRSMFKGRPSAKFLKAPQVSQGQDKLDEIGVRVLEPDSGRTLFNLGSLPLDLLNDLEMMATTSYCRYCGRRSDGGSLICSGCGATL